VTAQGDRPRRGRFITLEGPDGAGKTSQAEVLCTALRATGSTVLLVREPGGTPVGERIRDLLLAGAGAEHSARVDALLFNAARAALVAGIVRPALERGEIVVSARFADSTVAYQGYGGGLRIEDLRSKPASLESLGPRSPGSRKASTSPSIAGSATASSPSRRPSPTDSS